MRGLVPKPATTFGLHSSSVEKHSRLLISYATLEGRNMAMFAQTFKRLQGVTLISQSHFSKAFEDHWQKDSMQTFILYSFPDVWQLELRIDNFKRYFVYTLNRTQMNEPFIIGIIKLLIVSNIF